MSCPHGMCSHDEPPTEDGVCRNKWCPSRTPTSVAERLGAKNARARIVGWMRTAYPMNRHALEWADAIEKCEDVEWSNAQHERSGDG